MKSILFALIALTFSGVAHAESAGPFKLGRYSLFSSAPYVELEGLVVKYYDSSTAQSYKVKAVVNVSNQEILNKMVEESKRDKQFSIVYEPSNVSVQSKCWDARLGYNVTENDGSEPAKTVCYEVTPTDIIAN